MVLIDQLLEVDVRIVRCKEDYSRDQKFIVPAIVLQLVARLLLVSQIYKYLPCIRSKEEGIRKTSQRISGGRLRGAIEGMSSQDFDSLCELASAYLIEAGATCLFGEDRVRVGGVTTIDFKLFQMRVSLCRCQW
jgi:hypothetical protein